MDPVEAGRQGGKASGGGGPGSQGGTTTQQGSDYKPTGQFPHVFQPHHTDLATENDGLRKDGQPDGRVKGN